MFGEIVSPRQKQTEAKTSTSQTLQVPKQVRFSIPGLNFIPDAVMDRQITEHDELCAAARARAAAVRAGKKQLEEANQMYEQTYLENLMELEYGPSCHCNRYPWQHELHPSGTVKRNADPEQRVEKADVVERDGAET